MEIQQIIQGIDNQDPGSNQKVLLAQNNLILQSQDSSIQQINISDTKQLLSDINNGQAAGVNSDTKISQQFYHIGGQLQQNESENLPQNNSSNNNIGINNGFLRFRPENCSSKTVLSPSGFMVQPSDNNEIQLAVTNQILEQGKHYVEFYCPFYLKNIEFGLVQENYDLNELDKNTYIIQYFKTTTSRVVGMLIDFDQLKIDFWLNGNYQQHKQLSINPGKWYICCKFKDLGNCVILSTNNKNPNYQNISYLKGIPQTQQQFQQQDEQNLEQFKEQVQQKTKEIKDLFIKQIQDKDSSNKIQQQNQNHVQYLQKSKNLLILQKNKIKLLRANNQGKFALNQSIFGNNPQKKEDLIYLVLGEKQAQIMLDYIDFYNLLVENVKKYDIFQEFMESFKNAISNIVNQGVLEIQVKFNTACQFIQATTDYIINQILIMQQILGNQQEKQNQEEEQNIQIQKLQQKNSLNELYQQLQILSQLNEQLYGISLNNENLQFLPNFNRIYSQFGRLASFIGSTNQQRSLIELSENGLYNQFETTNQLRHFECQNITLEDVQNSQNKYESLRNSLENQVPLSRQIQGLESGNVDLDVTINSLGYQEHKTQQKDQEIKLLQNQNSNYVSTLSTDGKMQLWNTEVGLLNMGGTDFKQTFKKIDESLLQGEDKNKENKDDIGFTEPFLFKMIENSLSDNIWVVQKPIEQVEKETGTTEVADPLIVDQLVNMGFPILIAQKAVLKTQNKGINEAMEIIFEIKEEEEQQQPNLEEKVSQIRNQWICSVCTLENFAPQTVCDVCQSPAPSDAYYTQAEIRKLQEQKEKQKKEEELKNKKDMLNQMQQEEEDKKRKEQEKLEKQIREQQRVQQLVEGSQVQDGFVLELQNSKFCPILGGVGFYNQQENSSLLKIRRFGYNPKYLKKFYKQTKNGYICTLNNEWIVNEKQIEKTLFENENNRLVIQALNPLFVQEEKEQQEFLTLSENIVEIQGEKLVKVGWGANEFSRQESQKDENFLYVLTDKAFRVYKVQADYIQPYKNVDQNFSVQLQSQKEIQIQCDTIQGILNSQDSQAYNIIILEGNKYHIFDRNFNKETLEYKDQLNLKSFQKINDDQILLFLDKNQVEYIDLHSYKNLENQQQNLLQLDGNSQDQNTLQDQDDNWTQNLTPQDINSMQMLTQTQPIGGHGINCDQLQDFEQQSQKYSKFLWKIQQDQEDKDQKKEFIVEFDEKISLVKLNIQGQFTQKSQQGKISDTILQQFKTEFQAPQVYNNINNNQQEDQQIQGEQQLIVQEQQSSSQDSLQNQSDNNKNNKIQIKDLQLCNNNNVNQQQNDSEQLQQQGKKRYLPIKIVQYTGNQFKHGVYPTKMITPNDDKFVSNYPNTSFVFSNLGDKKMVIDQVTIQSSLVQRSAGYPVGSGLIFTSNNIGDIDRIEKFENFKSKQQYQEWRQNRVKFSQEIDGWEPVGCFEFTNAEQEELSIKLDYQREAKYVFLKPTNFRHTPKDFTKKYGIESVEIKFFGVQGQIVHENNNQQQQKQVQEKQSCQNNKNNMELGLEDQFFDNLQFEITLDGQKWEQLNDIQEQKQQIKRSSKILQHLDYQQNRVQDLQSLKNFFLQKGISLDAQSQIQFQHKTLKNTQIKGIKIYLKNNQEKYQDFSLQQISIQPFVSVDPQISNINVGQVRSALLDFNNYKLLNYKLVQSLVNSELSEQYRKNVQKLLYKLMNNDRRLVEQILQDLDLKQYIELNILQEKNQQFIEVQQFLKHFTQDNQEMKEKFAQKCLQAILEILPSILSQDLLITPVGLEGLFQLLDFSYVFDTRKVFEEILVQISKITQKIKEKRNPLYNILRQKFNINSLSFERDMFTGQSYSNILSVWQKQQYAKILQETYSNKNSLSIPSRFVSQKTQYSRKITVDLMHTYNISDIQLCFGKNLTSFSKFSVDIWSVDKDKKKQIIHSKNYPLHLFLQLANISSDLAYLNVFDGSQKLQALGLTGMDVQTRYLVIQINWSLNPCCVNHTETKNVPNMDIIPDIFGSKVSLQQEEGGENSEQLQQNNNNQYLLKEYEDLFVQYKKEQFTFIKEFQIGESRKYMKFQVDGCQQNQGTSTVTLYDGLNLYKNGEEIQIPQKKQQQQQQFQVENEKDQNLGQLANLETRLESLQSELQEKLLLSSQQEVQRTQIEKLCNSIEDVQVQKLKLQLKQQQQQQQKIVQKKKQGGLLKKDSDLSNNNNNENQNSLKNSLYFYYDLVSKLSQFLKKIQPQINETPSQLLNSQKGTKIGFELFEVFLVQEEGKIQDIILQLLLEVVLEGMSEVEWQQLIFKIIKVFLSQKPNQQQLEFSHSKIVNLMNKLSIPLGEIVSYLSIKMGIDFQTLSQQQQQRKQSIDIQQQQQQDNQEQQDLTTLQICLLQLLKLGYHSIPASTYDPSKVEHPGAYCFNCSFNRPIQGQRLKCANCPNLDCCSSEICQKKHLNFHPNHIFVIIEEPLPLIPEKKNIKPQPLLQQEFEFIRPLSQQHQLQCDGCGLQNIQGVRYMCANCEEFNICQKCYMKREHNKVHVFLKFDRCQQQRDINSNPVVLISQLDPLLYPLKQKTESLKNSQQKQPVRRLQKGLSREINPQQLQQLQQEENDDAILLPPGVKRSISQPDKKVDELIQRKYIPKTLVIIEEDDANSSEVQTIRLDYEDSLVAIFQIAVYTSDNQNLEEYDRITLLILCFDLLSEIMKLCSMQGIIYMLNRSDKDFFKLIFNVLKHKNQVLTQKFKEFLNNIIMPKNAPVQLTEQQIQGLNIIQKQKLQREKDALAELKLNVIYYLQTLLQWILDYSVNSIQNSNLYTQILRENIPKQQWLEHIEFVLSFLLSATEKIQKKKTPHHHQQQQLLRQSSQNSQQLQEKLDNNNNNEDIIQQEENNNDDDVFIQPPKLFKSISVKTNHTINPSVNHIAPLKQQQSKEQQEQASGQKLQDKNLINKENIDEFVQQQQGTTLSMQTALTLISLLNPQQKNILQKKQYNFLHSPQIWKLVLKAILKIKPSQLLEQKIFQNIVQSFLSASPDIQYPILQEVLKLTQNIIQLQQQQNQQKQLCFQVITVLFDTLNTLFANNNNKDNSTENNLQNSFQFQLVIGWLDVLLTKQSPKPQSYYNENANFKSAYARFSKEGALYLLNNATQFLISYANPGGRDGILMSTGGKIAQLQIADDMIKLLVNSEIEATLFQEDELIIDHSVQEQIDLRLKQLLNWYLMNRTTESVSSSPGVEVLKSLTLSLFTLFKKVGKYEKTCKLCLTALMQALKETDIILLEFYKKQKISSYTTLSFADRICKSLEELFDIWVASDNLAYHIAFENKGFEYFLDRMGINQLLDSNNNNSSQKQQNQQQQQQQQVQQQQKSRVDIFQNLMQNYKINLDNNNNNTNSKKSILNNNNQQQQSQDQNLNKLDFAGFKSSSTQIKDEELATHVKIINQPGQIFSGITPDWSTNKKGVKSSKIVELRMQGEYFNEYPLVIELKEEVEIKQLVIGFNSIEPTILNKMVGIPQAVMLEGGLSLDNMSSLGKLVMIEDDGFSNFSVKTFVKNFETIQNQNQQQQNNNQFENSLSNIPCKRVRYLRFRFRRPQSTCIDNLSIISGKSFNNMCIGISFLTISGYYVSKLPENVKSKIISTQQASALQTIGKLCDQQFQKMLNRVANNKNILEKFQNSFFTLSDLLTQYEKWLSPLILGIAQHNQEMGDWIISKFLVPGRAIEHAKLTCEIILSNQKYSLQRVKTVLEFILKVVQNIVNTSKQSNSNGKQLNNQFMEIVPFLEQLPNTLLISSQDYQLKKEDDNKLEIALSEQDCKNIIDIYGIFQESQYRNLINKLLTVLLYTPQPYILENKSRLIYSLNYAHSQYQQSSQYLELLTSLVIGGQQGVNWLLEESGQKLKKLIDRLVDNFQSQKDAKVYLYMLMAISRQKSIKSYIIKNQLELKVFNAIKVYDPKVKHMVKPDIDNEVIKMVVDFLKAVVVGEQENEKNFALLLKEDIIQLSKKQDMNYVQNILVPLLNAEYTVPVCFHAFDSVNNRWLSDPKQIIQYCKNLPKNQQLQLLSSSQQQQVSYQGKDLSQDNNNNGTNNNKQQSQIQQCKDSMQSTLLSTKQKDGLFENLKKFGEKSGFHKKLQNGSWKLAHTQNADSDYASASIVKEQVIKKAPYLIVLQGKNQSSKCIAGVFCSKGISDSEDDYGEFKIPLGDDCFMFYYEEDKFQLHFEVKQSSDNLFGYFYEEDGTVLMYNYNGIERILISFSDYEPSTLGINLNDMKPVDKQQKFNYPSHILNGANLFTFEKCEYFTFQEDSLKNSIGKQSIKQSLQLQQQQQQQLQQKSSQKLFKYSFNSNNLILPNNYFNIHSPLQNFRQPAIFNVPANMEVQRLIKMICVQGQYLSKPGMEELKLIETIQKQEIDKDKEIQFYYNQNQDENQVGVLDLEYDALQLFENAIIPKTLLQNSQEDTMNNYIPVMRIFEAFQKCGGVEKIIDTIIEQTSQWKNQKRAQNWKVYVAELKSFSSLPHFFGLFMKNKECVELLFSLMAGLPDQDEKEQKKKDKKDWDKEEQKAVKYSYNILGDVFKDENDNEIRQYAFQNNFIQSILDRMAIVSKEKTRQWVEDELEQIDEDLDEQNLLPKLDKKQSSIDGKKVIRKKKGLGYGSDQTGDNKRWDITTFLDQKKDKSEQILSLLDIIIKFLNFKTWTPPESLLSSLIESALLPILETALNNSLVDMSKEMNLMFGYFKLLKIMSNHKLLIPIFFDLDPHYQPKQINSLQQLLERAKNSALIYKQVSKTEKSKDGKENEQDKLADQIIESYEMVNKACLQYSEEMYDEDEEANEEEMKKILHLPLLQKYRLLLQDLRFDYVSMKANNNKYDHHYKSYITNNQPPQTKLVRLAQELADISTGLPTDHTNAIFARSDTERVDVMKVCIMGSNGTPYGHGAFIFDVFFEDSYPNGPPKVNLSTTGSGQVRFNPNLYSCGKVCLSLLGTWRGQAAENWDPKISTLLQVLVSIQSIIMAEEIYFNEPGHEHEAGTVEGEKFNEAYSNIVRYANIKYAMVDQLKNPPKGFETIIKRHFYLKKEEILEECEKWIKYSKCREANYNNGLITSHNSKWCSEFQKSKDRYPTMLKEAIDELKQELNKLEPPSFKELKLNNKSKKKKVKKQEKKIDVEKEGVVNLDEIDISYNNNDDDLKQKERSMDINDEKVKDRWSRYIGAMGIDAVAKQSKCSVFLSGLGSLGVEVAKNIILGGVKRFTIHDDQKVSYNDLAGQFFVGENDVGKNRAQASLRKIQELNYYVKVDTCYLDKKLPLEEKELESEIQMKNYNIVILIGQDYQTNIAVNNFCRKNGIKFITADLKGPFSMLFNDFGEKFEVVDKNGDDPVECIIQNISNEEEGIVKLLDGVKHPYEDGDSIVITQVEGMEDLKDQEKSINGSIHKITSINSNSFKIQDTRNYQKYIRNGIVKNIKMPKEVKFQSFENTYKEKEVPFDENMNIHDFMKWDNSKILHICFYAMNQYKKLNKEQLPRAWNLEDLKQFEKIALEFAENYYENLEEEKTLKKVIKYFSLSCASQFAPLAAFMGGYISQEIVKAITNKYIPTTQYFYTDCIEVLPDLPEKDEELNDEFIKKLNIKENKDRIDGILQCVGQEMMEKIQYSRIFMIGCGAIGCELLKNFAMINLFTGKQTDNKKPGLLTVTDPDHIENSNLNRQFLFREKHLRKPKSSTGAAVAQGMNPLLKGHIHARLDKVHDGTVNIYNDEFFEGLTMVTNALDNVQARRYVDMRCVSNKKPLLESGTLGPKGHVQVIMPYQTESYGSQQDPGNEDGEIPHCTLKMFPEETLHCVEWSRDKFGKLFTLRPKSLLKIIEDPSYQPNGPQELKVLREVVKLLKNKPANFDDCIKYAAFKFYKYFRNDIRQLLYTYPPDMKTKDGEPFWKLPKRPPQEISYIDPKNKLHGQFIAAVAVMRAKIFKIQVPKNYRKEEGWYEFASKASQLKVPDFQPSDSKAKEISSQVDKDKEEKKEDKEQQEEDQPQQNDIQNYEEEVEQLMKELDSLKSSLPKSSVEPKKDNEHLMSPEEFEKDEDDNGHIDYIHACANMRSTNYKLEPMEWLQVKLKAGRIVPALATTTAAIAGLQTIELVKILKNEKKENMKNAFLNLAVPILQLTEPGDAPKIKLHDDLSVNLWDRWEVKEGKTLTLKQLFEHLENTYKLSPQDVFLGNRCIYSGMVMSNKDKEREAFQARQLEDILEVDDDQKYLDLTVTFSLVGDKEKQILKDTPPIRIYFNKCVNNKNNTDQKIKSDIIIKENN